MGSLEEPRAAVQSQSLYCSYDPSTDAQPSTAVQNGHDQGAIPPGPVWLRSIWAGADLAGQ
eukprot:1274674-Amphidinium_carterae.1